MREIKFRGKRLNNGEWIYGYYVKCPSGQHRIYLQPFEGASANTYLPVLQESIGQFTGLLDKNGVEIYEGDIVIAWDRGTKAKCEVRWRQEANPCFILFPAWQSNQMWSISATKHDPGKQFISVSAEITTTDKKGYYDDGLEVIGNIYENPELLNV